MKAYDKHNSFSVNALKGADKGGKGGLKGGKKGEGGKKGGGKGKDGGAKNANGCKFMAKYGNCSRGDDCGFSHDPAALAAYKKDHPEYVQAWEHYSNEYKGDYKGAKGKKGKRKRKG